MFDNTPVVYVVPPNDALKCPLHEGILEDPVDTPCGCTFCRSCILDVLNTTLECPVHGTPLIPEHLRENPQVQGHINALLIHCKGGLQRTVSGEWVTNPQGCRIWVKLGNRAEHEDVCLHVNNVNEKIERHTPVRTCIYREHGCLFIGNTEQDIMVHGGVCGYGRLLGQIEQLQNQLSQRDLEIERLTNLLTGQQKSSFSITLPDVPNVTEVIDSISRGLDKLDQDSTKLFEDAKDTLMKTKTKAYRSSLKVLHSIKEVVELAKTEFIAKLEELELIAKDKVRMITSSSTNTTNQPATSSTTTTTTTTSQSNDVSNVVTSSPSADQIITNDEPIAEQAVVVSEDSININNNNNNNVNTNNQSTPANNNNTSADAAVANDEVTEGDEDLKEFLEASKQEYLQFEAARMAEEEAIRHAMRLSLLDLASKE